MPKCVKCEKTVEEVCGGGYCPDCHISLSWEDCITDTSVARNNLKMDLAAGIALGIPRKEIIAGVKRIYPAAKLEEYKELEGEEVT